MTMDYLLWVCSLIVPAVLAVEGTSRYYYHLLISPPSAPVPIRMNNGDVSTRYWQLTTSVLAEEQGRV